MKKNILYMVIVQTITLCGLASLSLANTSLSCPLGAKEESLSVGRVMRNFGRYFSNAESISIRGAKNPEEIPSLDLAHAIEDLNTVMSCAQIVIENPHGDLLPSKIEDLPSNEQQAYLHTYLNFMRDFKAQVFDFQTSLKTQQSLPAEQRNFQEALLLSKKINQLINEAHDIL